MQRLIWGWVDRWLKNKMTHSLHRQGSADSLRDDYILLCTPSIGLNNRGAGKKLKQILEIIFAVGPTNIGFYGHGNRFDNLDYEIIKSSLTDNSRLRCCFDSIEKVKKVLVKIKKGNFGISMALSGPVDEILALLKNLDLYPHTINVSCGVFGKTELLQGRRQEMEISTMCGHGMIGWRLVKQTMADLNNENIDIEKAIQRLCKPCTCGIFNPSRAGKILKKCLRQ